jgi:hypothetical protein
MAKIRDWVLLLPLLLPMGSVAEPLMSAESFVPQPREDVLLSPEESRLIENFRKDTYSYTAARLFLANMEALHSDVVDVEIGGKSQRYFAWKRSGVTQDPTTQKITERGPDYAGADGFFLWTGSTSLPARGRPTAQFSWGGFSDHGLSGQFVIDGVMYSIGTLGRFHVLLFHARPLSAIPGTGPQYVCVDSTGAVELDEKPVPRCDRPQRQRDPFGDPGPPVPATLTKEDAEPFGRLHAKLRVSPLHCASNEITYCEDMVRISCNAGADWPVRYFDNATAELLGTCGFWVRDPTCMPQRWKACAVKSGVRHIGEEPDPSR